MKLVISGLSFNLRKAIVEDYVFCRNLEKRNMSYFIDKYRGGWDAKKFRADFDISFMWVLTYKSKRIAYFRLSFDNDFAYLHNIQVSGLMRGRGIGTKLLFILEQKVLKKNFKKIRLTVFKDNLAKDLYFKLGYIIKKTNTNSFLLEKIL